MTSDDSRVDTGRLDERLDALGARDPVDDPDDLDDGQRRLYEDATDADAPEWFLTKLRRGVYHDYESPAPMPKHVLVADAQEIEEYDIAQNARTGKYDP